VRDLSAPSAYLAEVYAVHRRPSSEDEGVVTGEGEGSHVASLVRRGLVCCRPRLLRRLTYQTAQPRLGFVGDRRPGQSGQTPEAGGGSQRRRRAMESLTVSPEQGASATGGWRRNRWPAPRGRPGAPGRALLRVILARSRARDWRRSARAACCLPGGSSPGGMASARRKCSASAKASPATATCPARRRRAASIHGRAPAQ
jgi:hypothetical protein